jgi:integrase
MLTSLGTRHSRGYAMGWTRKLESGRWQACYRDASGKQHADTFKRKVDADRYLVTVEADVLRGTYQDPARGKELLSSFWGRWRQDAGDRLRPSTLDIYDSRWRLYVADRLGRQRLGSITRLDVQNLVADLRAREVGASTIGQVLRLTHRVLAAAVDAGLIGKNPASGVQAPRLPHKEMNYIDPSGIGRLVAAVPERWSAFVLVAAYGGLRFGELAALRVERVDFLRRSVRVEDAFSEVNGKLHLGPTKTGKSRSVSLPKSVVDALALHLRRYPSGPDGLVFRDENGGPVRRSNFNKRIWQGAVRAAGLAPLRFHDLRHTSVALGIAAGGHPKAIQARAGHSSIRTTLDRYGHLFEGIDSDLADRLDSFAQTSIPTTTAAGLLLKAVPGDRQEGAAASE